MTNDQEKSAKCWASVASHQCPQESVRGGRQVIIIVILYIIIMPRRTRLHYIIRFINHYLDDDQTRFKTTNNFYEAKFSPPGSDRAIQVVKRVRMLEPIEVRDIEGH